MNHLLSTARAVKMMTHFSSQILGILEIERKTWLTIFRISTKNEQYLLISILSSQPGQTQRTHMARFAGKG